MNHSVYCGTSDIGRLPGVMNGGPGTSAKPGRTSRTLGRQAGAFLATVLLSGAVWGIATEALEGGGSALVVTGTSLTADETSALNGNSVSELWKTGDATLTAAGIASFSGTVRVKGGVYRILDASGWGASAAKVYVSSGATLYAAVSPASPESKEVHISGAGNGTYPSFVKNRCAVKLVLDDDASVAALGNWTAVADTLDMQGHTLTFNYCGDNADKRSEFVWPSASRISNPGHVVMDASAPSGDREGALTFCFNSAQMQGPDHTLTVRGGHVDWYLSDKDCNWTLRLETSCDIGYAGAGGLAAGKTFKWSGPVEIAGGATFNLKPGPSNPVVVSGPISGPGGVAKLGSGSVAYLKGTNTYTGVTSVAGGSVLYYGARSMASSDPAKYAFSNGGAVTLRLNGGEITDGFSSEDSAAILSAFSSQTGAGLQFASAEGVTARFDYSPSRADDTIALGAYTNALFGLTGETVVHGTFTGDAPLTVRTAAPLTLSADTGAKHAIGTLSVESGTAVLKDFGAVDITSKDVSIGGETALDAVPRLVLEGDTHLGQDWSMGSVTELCLARGDARARGVLEIRDGATITNKINNVGGVNSSYGVVRQSGGYALWSGVNNGAYDAYFGNASGQAFFDLSGGRMDFCAWGHFAAHGSATAVLYLSDSCDVRQVNAEMQIGWNGSCVYYQTGGRLTTQVRNNPLRVNSNNWAGPSGGFGQMVVADAGVADLSVGTGILMSERTNGVAHVALVDGGRLIAPKVQRAVIGGGNNKNQVMPFPELCNGAYPSYFHFNGGVLQAAADGDILGVRTAESDSRPTDVVVYSRGAVIDSSNLTVTVNAPLKAPAGQGVLSIEAPTGADASGYLGAPVVKIVGDGAGATAVAEFDRVTGTVTGIRVTSPGWNYTTAYATLTSGGKTAAPTVQLACTLGTDAGGSLTACGTGTVVLNAANTYGGRTVLAGGTLKLACEGALPAGSAVQLSGGVLDANGFAAPTSWFVDGKAALTNGVPFAYAGDLSFPSGSTVTVENLDPDEDLAERRKGVKLLTVTGSVNGNPVLVGVESPLWRLFWNNGTLVLGRLNATTFIVR